MSVGALIKGTDGTHILQLSDCRKVFRLVLSGNEPVQWHTNLGEGKD